MTRVSESKSRWVSNAGAAQCDRLLCRKHPNLSGQMGDLFFFSAPIRAKSLDDKAECLTKAAAVLSDNFTAVDAARRKVVELEETIFGAVGEDSKGGVLYLEWKECLKWKNISLQTYWNGTLVGPDCRRFLAEYRDICHRLRAKNFGGLCLRSAKGHRLL